MITRLSSLTLAAAACFAAPAYAAFPSSLGTCSFSDVKAGGVNANDCRGAFPGNEVGEGADPGRDATTAYINSQWGPGYTWYGELPGTPTLTGTITLPMVFTTPFVVSLKGAGEFALYQFNNSNGVSVLDFSTIALKNDGGNQPEWSHSGLWTAPIPEPEAYVLALGALAVLGLFGRRRAKAA